MRGALLGVLGFATGCAIIAGIDGEYRVGDIHAGGSGAGTATAGSGPGPGGNGGTGNMAGSGGHGGPNSGGMGGDPQGGGGAIQTGGMGGMGGTGPTFVVACPGFTCDPGEVCCVEPSSGNPTSGCAAPGGCPGGEFEVSCDGPEDCADAEVCCGDFNGFYTAVTCATSCSGSSRYVMCGGDNPGSQNCPTTESCFPSTALPGHRYCD